MTIIRVGLDTAKHVFQVHGVDENEQPVLRRQLPRGEIDAAAICEAMSRPGMRFVAVKSAERQAALMLLSARDLPVKQRTVLIDAMRGHAAEFGVVAAKGPVKLSALLQRVHTAEAGVPGLACWGWRARSSA